MDDHLPQELDGDPKFDDEEVRELAAEARSILASKALKYALSEGRRRIYAELAAAIPGDLTSVRLHVKLLALEEIPRTLKVILNEDTMRTQKNSRTRKPV